MLLTICTCVSDKHMSQKYFPLIRFDVKNITCKCCNNKPDCCLKDSLSIFTCCFPSVGHKKSSHKTPSFVKESPPSGSD